MNATNAPAAAPARRGSRRRVSAMTAVLVLLVGVVAASDAFVNKAAAAGLTTKPDIYGCFVWGWGVPYANQPVHLQAWYPADNAWKVTRSTKTNAAGCVRFNDITVRRYYKLAALTYWPELCYGYAGDSGYIYTKNANDYLYRVGTNWANLFQLC
jgi:hypothetical protein